MYLYFSEKNLQLNYTIIVMYSKLSLLREKHFWIAVRDWRSSNDLSTSVNRKLNKLFGKSSIVPNRSRFRVRNIQDKSTTRFYQFTLDRLAREYCNANKEYTSATFLPTILT